MEYFMLQEQFVDRYGIEMHDRLYRFVNNFGKEAYMALLETASIIFGMEVQNDRGN